jgi:hypothetical protein
MRFVRWYEHVIAIFHPEWRKVDQQVAFVFGIARSMREISAHAGERALAHLEQRGLRRDCTVSRKDLELSPREWRCLPYRSAQGFRIGPRCAKEVARMRSLVSGQRCEIAFR